MVKKIAAMSLIFSVLGGCAIPAEEQEVTDELAPEVPESTPEGFGQCLNWCADEFYRCENFCWRGHGDYYACYDQCDAEYYACGDWCAGGFSY